MEDPMSRMTYAAALISALVVAGSAAAAQGAAAAAPKPGPEHQRLDYFAGTWKSDGEMKPGPFGPGGAMSGTVICEWFEGGFHLLCRSQGDGPMGETYALGIMGYNAASKRYTYYGIDNTGAGDPAYGRVSGATWVWEGEGLVGGQVMKSRYALKQLDADRYSWSWEVSGSSGAWTLVAQGTDTRQP
jgi:hypothetical protein